MHLFLSISLWAHFKKDLRPHFRYVDGVTHKNNPRLCLHWLYLLCTGSPDTFALLGSGKAPCSLLGYSLFFSMYGKLDLFSLEKPYMLCVALRVVCGISCHWLLLRRGLSQGMSSKKRLSWDWPSPLRQRCCDSSGPWEACQQVWVTFFFVMIWV